MNKFKNLLLTYQSLKEMFKDKNAPKWPKIVGILALIYLISPVDLVTDIVPVVGLLDDLAILLATATAIGKSLKNYKRTTPAN